MLCPPDFSQLVPKVQEPDDRRVMARVLLNLVYDQEQFPVDLSEVLKLQGHNRVFTRALLAWCAIRPESYASWSEAKCHTIMADVRTEESL